MQDEWLNPQIDYSLIMFKFDLMMIYMQYIEHDDDLEIYEMRMLFCHELLCLIMVNGRGRYHKIMCIYGYAGEAARLYDQELRKA